MTPDSRSFSPILDYELDRPSDTTFTSARCISRANGQRMIVRSLRAVLRRWRLGRSDQFLIAPSTTRAFELPEGNSFEHSGQTAGSVTVISYCTRDGVYDHLAERLRESCESAGMESDIETIPKCSYRNACLFKPTFIKFKLLTLGKPILWLDGDAFVKSPISLPEGDWDIGTLTNDRRENPVNLRASLCIAFRPTVAALRFVEMWEQFCAAHWLQPGFDHRRFNYALHVLEGSYAQVDITPFVSGKLIRDLGGEKQHTFVADDHE